jgi:hypothetical protein
MHIVRKLSVGDRPRTTVMPLKRFYYSAKHWCVQASIVINRPAQTEYKTIHQILVLQVCTVKMT